MHKIIDAELLELKHDGAKIGAQDLRIRVLLHFTGERLLCVKSETLSRLCTTSSACSLLGASFRDGRDKQGLDANAWVVDLLLGEAGVDDEDNAVDCQRGFGNVGGDHDLKGRKPWLKTQRMNEVDGLALAFLPTAPFGRGGGAGSKILC